MPRPGGEPVEFDDCECRRETAMAPLVCIDGREIWVPESVVHDDSEVFDADDNASDKFVVKEWWATREGLT